MKYIYNRNLHSFLSGVALFTSPVVTSYAAELEWDTNVTRAMGFDSVEIARDVYDLLINVIDYNLEYDLSIIDIELHDRAADHAAVTEHT